MKKLSPYALSAFVPTYSDRIYEIHKDCINKKKLDHFPVLASGEVVKIHKELNDLASIGLVDSKDVEEILEGVGYTLEDELWDWRLEIEMQEEERKQYFQKTHEDED